MTTSTKVTHTPGPWKVVKQIRFDENALIVAGDSKVIAEVWHSARIDSNPDVDLLTAAPDMLEALVGIGDSLGCVDQCFENGLKTHSPACERVKAAIAKAKGGAA